MEEKLENITEQVLNEIRMQELTKYDDALFEMANIIKADHAELPSNIFISQNNGYQHGPRIKFQTNKAGKVQRNSMATMTISDSPQIIGDVGELSAGDVQYFKSFVLNNKDVLLAYWNAEIEIERVLSLLRY